MEVGCLPESIADLIRLLAFFAMLAASVAIAVSKIRGVLKRGPVDRLLREARVVGDRVLLEAPSLFVKGVVGVTVAKGAGVSAVLRVKYKATGPAEEKSWLPLSEVCSQPPILRVSEGLLHFELPAFYAVSGSCRGLLVACFDTSGARLKNSIEALLEQGYLRGSLRVEGGLARARLEYSGPSATSVAGAQGSFVLELCVEGFYVRGCSELAELNRPGVVEKTYKYPVAKKLLVGAVTGEGLEGLAELAETQVGVLGFNNAYLRLARKKWLSKKPLRVVRAA
ncbi:MAG: hypothetical protein ACP5KA_04285 [Desulfurococcaceae archaeon]